MQAFEPSLQACELTLAGEKISLGEVFRNQNLTRCKIISRAEFESLTFSFKYRDPITENQIDYSFIQGDFKKVKNAGLFHFAKYVNTATMHKAVDIGIYKTDSLEFYPRERYQERCCSQSLWYQYKDQQTNELYQALVPLKKVEIKGVFNGGISTVEVQLSYKNKGNS